jgi:hypothetical protein
MVNMGEKFIANVLQLIDLCGDGVKLRALLLQ